MAALALEAGADEDQAIAALLHDAAEDQGGQGRLDDIRVRYGERVATIVADCTDAMIEPKPPWRRRKEAYLASLTQKPAESLLVSLADKIYNAEAIVADLHAVGAAVWSRFSAGPDEVRWYYRSLAVAFEQLISGSASRRLQLAVDTMTHSPPRK